MILVAAHLPYFLEAASIIASIRIPKLYGVIINLTLRKAKKKIKLFGESFLLEVHFLWQLLISITPI